MKKYLSIFLILILVMAVMMTGCGGASETSETDEPQGSQNEQNSEDAENVDTEGLGDLLSSAYVDMMKNNEYMMKYKATMESEGQSMEVESTIAVSGDDTAMISSGSGFDSNIIFKDDIVYMVDHTNKTVVTWAQSDADETDTIDTEGITYIGSGEEDGLVYEEYSAIDNNVKYYFDGKKLVKMVVLMEGQTMVMDILEMSKNVPASMFEIPAGYQELEM